MDIFTNIIITFLYNKSLFAYNSPFFKSLTYIVNHFCQYAKGLTPYQNLSQKIAINLAINCSKNHTQLHFFFSQNCVIFLLYLQKLFSDKGAFMKANQSNKERIARVIAGLTLLKSSKIC